MGTLGSVATVHTGDHGWRHHCNATGEKQTSRKTTRFCGLRCFPHSGLRAPVPDVAGGEPLVEKILLDVGAGLLEQGSKVPENAHIGQLNPKPHVDLEDRTQDAQVESLGIRMTSWCRPPVSDHIQSHVTARSATPDHEYHQQGLFAIATRIGEKFIAGTWPLTIAKGMRQKRSTVRREG